MKLSSEVKIDLCRVHKDIDLSLRYPEHIFNICILFPPRRCQVDGCTKDALYVAIGLMVPEAVGEIKRSEDEKICRGSIEIWREGKEMLDGGSAEEKLHEYLVSRIVPSNHRPLLATRLINKLAKMTLDKLDIEHGCTLSDRDKHRILKELGMYPIEEQYE